MKSFLYILLAVFFGVIILEGIYYFSKPSSTANQTSNQTVQPAVNSTNKEATSQKLQIIYQAKNDPEGRTIIYSKQNAWKGSGINMLPPWVYAVGLFDHWENILGSLDRYLYLTDPVNKIALDKIRVVFQDNQLFPNKGKQTVLQAENLTNTANASDEIENIGFISTVNNEKLNNIIKKGDALLAVLLTKTNLNPITEENYSIAQSLVVRRFHGKNDINP